MVGRFVVPIAILVLLVFALQFVVDRGSPPLPESILSLGQLADPDEVYDPVRVGETLQRGFRQLLRRDAILPVYDPTFVRPEETA